MGLKSIIINSNILNWNIKVYYTQENKYVYMGCGCKKKQEEPKTVEELHTKELNEWNGGINKEEDGKEETVQDLQETEGN